MDDLDARVDISRLHCRTHIDHDHDSVRIDLHFLVTVSALESRIITVCRYDDPE